MARNAASGAQSGWDRAKYLADHVHPVAHAVEELDKPYIVAVNGAATGAGMDMALMGDLRFAAESARFAETYIKVGFVAGDGGAWMLPRLVGRPKALEMLWLGDFVSAQEAERIGLVNKVVPVAELEAAVARLAATMAAHAPLSLATNKMTVKAVGKDPADRDMGAIRAAMAACFDSADYREGRRAFMEKRRPAFTGT